MTNEQKRTLKWVEAYKNPIQLDIIIYLLIYKKLSLTDLCSKLKKSKPTISKHTKELISLDIIEEDEKSRILNIHKNLSMIQKKSIESKPYLHVSFISDKYKDEFNKEREIFNKKMSDLSRKSFNVDNDKMNNVYCEVFFNFDQIINN